MPNSTEQEKLSQSAKPPATAKGGLRERVDFIALNIFLGAWLLLAAIQIAPPGPLWVAQRAVIEPVTDVWIIRQFWGVFAPTFRDFNEHGMFFVDYADGTVGLREHLRLGRIDDQLERSRRGKIREYIVDNLLTTEQKDSYPFVGRFVARATNIPENPAARVTLGANWSRILAEPYTKINDLPQDCFHFSFFTYAVKPEDLK